MPGMSICDIAIVSHPNSEFESVSPEEDPIAQEVIEVVREWGVIMKRLFQVWFLGVAHP